MSFANPKASTEYTAQNKVELVRAGKPFFDSLLQLINNAKESLHLQIYIYDDDETGIIVGEALKAAAKRNVKVYLLADGYASQVMSQDFIDDLRSAGVQFKMFEPLLKSKWFYLGRRLHHKVVVADAEFALVGGVNITNRYNDMPGKQAWLDFAVKVEGEIARELCVLCWKTWYGFPSRMEITPCEEKKIVYTIKPGEASLVRMRREDWVRRKSQVSRTYIEMLRNAKSDITILCSYFLPGKTLRQLMRNASKRGVKIKIITAGRSDIMTAKYAERWLYDWLLRNKIVLYEYQKNILHGKIAVCDTTWVTAGSYNINNLSAHASIELNLDIKNTDFAKQVESTFEKIIKDDCIEITQEYHLKAKNIFVQFLRWLSFQFLRFTLYLVTFYFKQRG